MTDGPAWRSRAVTPSRLSSILGVFFATLAATPLATHAGDLLRGGAGAGGRGNVPGSNPSSAQATAQARANAQDMLSRTTQAVKAVQAMQNVARSTAIGGADNAGRNPATGLQLPNVPNGLTPGGLVPQVGGTWTGANQPTQTTSSSQALVNITQTNSQAVLNWSSFNVGRKTTLNFDQSFGGSQTSQWIAYNIVNDPTGIPSQILGSIQANGQVFVVNRNGIIFGGSSQVNTHALFASSLPINTNLIQSGLLANPDQQFLFSGLTIPAGSNGTPTFTPDAPYGTDYGDVAVQAGATLTAPTTSSHVGGRVVLAGRNITNAGSISTPDGQTILAAGRQIGFDAHSSGDASLRGLDAYVGAVDASSGAATNAGMISVPRGDAMITGKTVQQNGVIDSSTTVTLNGRVDLLANFNSTPVKNNATQLFQLVPTSTGTVSLGDGSVTRILPEWSSSETNVGTQLPLPSQVIVQGQSIHMGKNATLLAPGATGIPNPNNAGAISGALDEAGTAQTSGVTFSAGSWVLVGSVDKFVNDVGQISLDSGATIDVSGSTDIVVPTSQNILSVQLRGTELADSPTQRTGVFRGTTLQVDLRNSGVYNGSYWVGTPLANVSGYVGLIQHSVGELTVAGGTVSLGAGGSVVVQSGATINVSGGWVHYTGGMVQTSRVVTGDHVVDVSKATPDQVYGGFYTGRFTDYHNQWGVANVYSSPLALAGAHYEPAYDQGANGGTLSISAPTMALNGTLLGNTITGDRQTRTTTTSSTLPAPSSLKLSFTAQDPSFGTNYPTYSPTPPNITFQSPATGNSAPSLSYDASFRLTGSSAANVVLSSKLLTDDGFGSLTIDNRDGNITIPSKVALKTMPTGSVTLTGANIDVEGSIAAPSGSIALNVWDIPTSTFNTLTVNTGAFTPPTPPADPSRGNFTLGSSASLTTAGLIVDDRRGVSNLPISLNGGSITVTSYNAFLKPGSVIDVSGGVAVSSTGKRAYGNGGSITINSGNDVNIPSVLGGKLVLGSTLRGFSSGGGSSSVASFTGGGNGGSLSIQATMIQIGGTPSSANVTELSPDFFNQGGFGSFTLTGLGAVGSNGQFLPGINIAPNTVIAPVVQSLMASTSSAGVNLVPVAEPPGIRTPVNLTFNAPGVSDKFDDSIARTRGDFIMGAGAAIVTDPLGTVTIKSQTAAVLGSIVAPGGAINITTTNSNATDHLNPTAYAVANLELGPHSYLSTAGTVVLLPDRRGYLTGSVLPGGSITIAGNIVAEAGSVINVSGASGILDLAPSYSNESAPLIGALSGAETSPQRQMPAAAFRGALVTTLPDGTSLTGSYVESGSFSGAAVFPTRVASNGGSITLQGDKELFTDATLLGNAGSPAATGGTLNVSSGVFAPGFIGGKGTISPLTPFLQIIQSGSTIPTQSNGSGPTTIGHPVLDSNGTAFNGSGYIAVSSFAGGGFDTLVLGGSTGAVAFSGPVSIAARGSITLGNGGLISADSTVNLRAPYVQLGIPFQAPISSDQTNPPLNANLPPKYGPGSLNVTGQLIDVGNLSLQNIGRLTLTAINGDIRGDGTLDVAGNIVMQAGQIYPASAVTFTISAYDYSLGGVTQSGSITILPGGTRQLPLSAAGQLNLYGSIINQAGTLRAPFGSINIGWDGTGTGPVDPVSGATVAVTKQVTLSTGSITSVSAVDPTTGQEVVIPYGFNVNGTSWIDPSGTNITAGLVPQKSVNISGLNVNTQTGSTIDLRGGGDLYAYQWVGGTGGTTDILSWNFAGAWGSGKNYSASQIVSYKGAYWYALTATTAESATKAPSAGTYWKQVSPSFAVIPGYQADYAPYASYNTIPSFTDSLNLGVDQGYVNNLLHIGSQIYLNATPGLKAGVYTLLPARYALLPGAFLVTPQTTASAGTFTLTDNSSVVAGYSFNNLNQSTANPQLYTTVAVAPASTFLQRASYTDYLANTYLREEAQILGIQVARMPSDAGSLVLSGSASLVVNGDVYGHGAAGGRGAVIDLSTSENILIGGPGGAAPAGTAYLDATRLDSFGAESLLIGGIRQITSSSTTITVKTPSITVDNAGAALAGPEIILVANQNLTLAAGADIEQKGSIPQNGSFPPPPIIIGSSATPGSSDGVLLRVSDTATTVSRPGINLADTVPNVTIGAGANIAGNNILVDSTAGGTLDPTATINGQNISIKAGVISIELNNPGTLQSNPGIVLQGTALNSLLGTGTLSLSAYSSIDIYGTGSITANNLGLHASDLRGFTNNQAGVVTINAASVTLDNASAGNGTGAVSGFTPEGSLNVNAGTIYTGANTLTVDQYANVFLNATTGVVLQNTGGISSQTNLTLSTPIIVGSAQASQTITAKGGPLNILDPSSGGASSLAQQSGLGATLSLVGNSITQNSVIYLPSGVLNLEATSGDLNVGGTLDVSGTAQNFYDVIQYTSAGNITLRSDTGNVILNSGSVVSVAADPNGGNAGSVSVSAPTGYFSALGTLSGQGGLGGTNGVFSLDSKTFDATGSPSMSPLDSLLNTAHFTQSRTYRVRSGNVNVDGTADALNYSVSADAGDITVTSTGLINASGITGGSISLIASGNLTLQSGAMLTVAAQQFSSAGKGGSVDLEAGAEVNGTFNQSASVTIGSGSTIDLSVAANTASSAADGDFTGTLHIRAPQNNTSTGLGVNPILGNIIAPSSIVVEGYRIFDLTGTGGNITNPSTL
jgi:filamentous hemagglutinin family protein